MLPQVHNWRSGDRSRTPGASEFPDARYQGRMIAETANKLHG